MLRSSNRRTYKGLKWLIAILCVLWGCAGPQYKPPERPELGLSEIEAPPQKTKKGRVITLSLGELNASEKDALASLGVPTAQYDTLYIFTPQKAMKAAELRSWADTTYWDARFNKKIAEKKWKILWDRLIKSERKRFELVEQKNSWWNQHRAEVFFISGFVVGSTSSILIVHGIDR
jgi:hypothetical protein